MLDFAERLDDFLVKYLAYFNYKKYISKMNLKGNEKILEVGCGGGNLSRFMARKLISGKLVCIDNSNYWINKAGKGLEGFKNVELVQEDILDFEKKNYFDLVVVHYMLHGMNKKEKAIECFKNNLRQKGKIYIREPIRKSHGIPSKEIEELMGVGGFLKGKSKESYSFPMRGKVYEGVFVKILK